MRYFLITLGALFAPIHCLAASKPNILIIMADDMGYSDLGCFGGEIPTPNIDRMAEKGLRFTQFHNTGRCCPTRASLLTGLYPHQTGIGHMTNDKGHPSYQGYLNDRCVTIAEVLKPAGYFTCASGKWHVGGAPEHWPTKRGFDRFYGIPQGGGIYFKLKKGRDLVLDEKKITPPDAWYCTDAFTDHAIRFAREAKEQGKPFFLYLPHIAPHWPLKAKPEDIAKHLGKYKIGWDKLRQQRYEKLINKGIISKQWEMSPRDARSIPWEEEAKKQQMDLRMAVYAAQVECMDRNIGRLLDALKEMGGEENTLVLFLMDNGGCAEGGRRGFNSGKKGAKIGTVESHASYGLSWANLSNTPFRMYKHWVHEGGIATPLVAYWPKGITRHGELVHQPGHVIDLMPTCVDLSGASYPKEFKGKRILPLEGRSLVPAMAGQRLQREALYWEHEGNRAVRVGDWKLVAKHKGPWELYDLKKDRTELHDLAEKDPVRVAEMKLMYERWAKRSGVLPWPVRIK